MLISRVSPLSGLHAMDLDVTDEQLKEWKEWPRRKIQDIFPNLTPPERGFLLTGYTQADWDEMFKQEEEEENDEDDNLKQVTKVSANICELMKSLNVEPVQSKRRRVFQVSPVALQWAAATGKRLLDAMTAFYAVEIAAGRL